MATTEAIALARRADAGRAIRTSRATSSATASASTTRSTARGEPTVLLLPTWSLIHSRHWKMQIPYLARHCRVVTFDGRGNGRSDRPQNPAAYDEREFAADALAVLDATETEARGDRGASHSVHSAALLLAAEHPERVDAAVLSSGRTSAVGGQPLPERAVHHFDSRKHDTYEGWAKYNRYHWLRDYNGFVEFFISQIFTEPHSTKPIRGLPSGGRSRRTARRSSATQDGPGLTRRGVARDLCRRVRCPVLVIHGDEDAIASVTRGAALAEQTGRRASSFWKVPDTRRTSATRSRSTSFFVISSLPPPPGLTLDSRQVAAQARPLHLLADRARPRAARRRDRGRAPKAPPRPRARLARAAPGHGRARGARGADPPRQRPARERVAPHRERVGRARPALLPGDPADGRDPARELHGLPRSRAR